MRRLIGLIALLVLIFGAAWLVHNGYDRTEITGLTDFPPVLSADESVPPPDDPEESASAEAPTAASKEPDADTQAAEAPVMPEEAPMAAEAPESGSEAAEAPSEPEAPAAEESVAETEAAEAPETEAAGALATPPQESGNMAALAPPPADEPEAAPPPVGVVPTFDVVRVEPSGETVIAGVAAPRAAVEVLNSADPIAMAEANERGEWALVVEVPLPPGTHDLAIRTTSPDKSEVTLSDQRVAVLVPENGDEEPLVVLNMPDAPSTVMQRPSGTEAAAAPEAAPATKAPASAGGADIAAAPGRAAGPEISAEQQDAMAAEEGQPGATEMAAAPEAAQAVEDPAPAGATEMATEQEDTTMAEEPAPGGDTEMAATPEAATPGAATPEAATPGAAPPSESAAPDAMAPASPPAAPAPESDIAATPEEPAMTPDASDEGEGTAGQEMAAVGPAEGEAEAPASAEAESPMTADPSDAMAPGAAGAAPDTTAPEAAGEEPDTMAESGEAPAEPTVVEEPASPPEPEPVVGVAAVEAESNGELYIAGTATRPEPVRVYVDGELVGEATPTENGTWLVETLREMPPDQYRIRADQVETDSGEVIARAEVPFEREVEVAVLQQRSESADQGSAETSGSLAGPMKVIIKRGDNLWRISREMYGRGIRYSTIYQANQDQIRDPDLIYPGQVFVLPAGNTAWEGQ